MKLLICPSRQAAGARTADLILAQVREKPSSVLGLATGGTMAPVYDRLAEMADSSTFAQVVTFNLDEYVGLPGDHPQSYRSFMRERFFSRVGIGDARAFLPKGDAADPHAEAAAYDARIRRAGGIDLQLLGIGHNGHIGFNEPTSSLASRTRVKTLARSTREANQRFFPDEQAAPRFAITMGIGTILEARHCVLLATGAGKAAAVAGMVEGPVSAACPASALQLHPRATIILDPDAAADLQMRDYYEYVHPEGDEGDPVTAS